MKIKHVIDHVTENGRKFKFQNFAWWWKSTSSCIKKTGCNSSYSKLHVWLL